MCEVDGIGAKGEMCKTCWMEERMAGTCCAIVSPSMYRIEGCGRHNHIRHSYQSITADALLC